VLNAKSFTIKAACFLGAFLILQAALLFTSCHKSKKPVIIWTSCAEFASYVEEFNASQDKAQAVVVYKKEPARSLPPAKDEETPDIIIGPWLKNSSTRKYFTPVDYMFSEQSINKSLFYSQLIDYGKINEKQYLLPVSFNLPAIVFKSENENLMPDSHLITLDEIKTVAGNFNQQNESGVYTAMGYGPSWDKNFLYLVSKLEGASYREKGTSFSWNSKSMLATITYLKDWTTARNTSTTAEQNFQFKYLYMPEYKQVSSNRCLFSYMTSDELFSLSSEEQSGLSFRWIQKDNTVPVDDDIITMGLYKDSKNTKDAEVFLSWFTKSTTQESILQRAADMHLDNITFGIANGFSSIKTVNENIYPTYYRQLLGNIPTGKYITTPNILPYRWPSLKEKVVIPFLSESTNIDSSATVASLETRIAEWSKQYF